MPDTADSLLREIVEMLGDRPYQALDKNGPFVCVFCGAVTASEDEPEHEAGCAWPRVLALVGWNSDGATPTPRNIGRPANEG